MIADIIHDIAAEHGNEATIYYPRPSLAGPERCIRQMVFWAANTKKSALPGRAIMVFDDSSWHEELTLDWLRKRRDIKIHSEQREVKINGIAGHIDAIMTIEGGDYLLEHKAVNDRSYQRLLAGDYFPHDYFTQLSLYMRGLSMHNGILLIKNKNTAAYCEYEGHYNIEQDRLTILCFTASTGQYIDYNIDIEHITEQAMSKFKDVETYTQSYLRLGKCDEALPVRQYNHDSWRCEYCPYSRKCWENYPIEHDKLSSHVKLSAEIEELLVVRQEAVLIASEYSKKKDDLTVIIKQKMQDAKCKRGVAGEYEVTWDVKMRNVFQKEKLHPELIAQYTESVPQEVFKVKKIK